jgi:hypothetical protein
MADAHVPDQAAGAIESEDVTHKTLVLTLEQVAALAGYNARGILIRK